MSKIKDLAGQRFGRLVIKCYSHSNKNGRSIWNCVCDCGKTLTVKGNALLSGNTQSCGCLKSDIVARIKFSHGQCGTRLYGIWMTMKNRCRYPNYKSKGIVVCEEWQTFEPFYEWAMANGYHDDLTIDRRDNDGNYCPENCRWVTRKVQNNNKGNNHKLTYNGETHTMAEWAEITGISYGNIRNRISKLKWSVEKTLTTPTKGS